jgi:glycosyltransferase involved in cell wall biosynthesis
MFEQCRRWVTSGAEVTVVTSPYEKSDIKAKGFISRQSVRGINLIVVDTADNNRKLKITRAANAILFSLTSCFYALFSKYDVLLVSSGPITVGIPLILAKKLRKIKTVFELRDLWPGGAVEAGLIRNSYLIKFGFLIEKVCYISADLVVCASSGQRDNIIERFPYIDPLVIPNASDNELFGKPAIGKIPEEFLGKTLFIHIGSLGLIHNVSYWLDVAKYFAHYDIYRSVAFVFIGEGAEREQLERRLVDEDIDNVYFMGLMPKIQLPLWLHKSYATLFATIPTKTQDACSPNKIFDSFAAGIPIIQTSGGWIKSMVSEHQCGINVPLNDPETTASMLNNYLKNPSIRNFHSKNARNLAVTIFDREKLSNKYYHAIENIIKT